LGEKRYSCRYCGQRFKRKRLLDCHCHSKHTFEKPYKCRICPAAFSYPEHARKHELTHCRQKNFTCDCSKQFKSKLSLERHQNNFCSNKNKFFCATCGTVLTSKSGLLEHLTKTGHPQGIIKEKENESKVTETRSLANFTTVQDTEGIIALSIDDLNDGVSREGYDDEVVLFLSRQPRIESNVYYSHDEFTDQVHIEQREKGPENDVDVMAEEVETAVLSIAPAGVDNRGQVQYVENTATGSFVEVVTDNSTPK